MKEAEFDRKFAAPRMNKSTPWEAKNHLISTRVSLEVVLDHVSP